MKYFGFSDQGKIREHNEDAHGIYALADNALLAVVCDGMGGLSCGEVASRLALNTFVDTVRRIVSLRVRDNRLALEDREAYLVLSNSASLANKAVMDYRRAHPECGEMGTTLVAAIICRHEDGATVSWINIGDSRIYTVDHRDILQVSRDHSYLQYLIDSGEMTPDEAARSVKKNLITRAIGLEDEIDPDIDTFPLSAKECQMTHIFLCSDGFSGAISEEECMAIVNNHSIPTEPKVKALIGRANALDGSDNITLVLVDLKGDDDATA